MTVHFIGAGPGAADLITVRGRGLIERCPVCLYAGSIVPRELIAYCPPGARVVDTAPLSLDEIEAEFLAAHSRGEDVARLHSGDLSIWSALAEQMRRLERRGIPYTLTPGVPAFAAAAAALGRELTLPEVAQSVVLTRVGGRASQMPAREGLSCLCGNRRHARHPSGRSPLSDIVAELAPLLGARLSRRGRDARLVARRAGRRRHADRYRGEACRAAGRAHCSGAGRTGAWRHRFPRQRALRSGLSAPVQGTGGGDETGRRAPGRPAGRRGRRRRSPARCRRCSAPWPPSARPAQRWHRRAQPPLRRPNRRPRLTVLAPTIRSASAADPPISALIAASASRSAGPRLE